MKYEDSEGEYEGIKRVRQDVCKVGLLPTYVCALIRRLVMSALADCIKSKNRPCIFLSAVL